MRCDAVPYARSLLRIHREVNNLFSESKINRPSSQSVIKKQAEYLVCEDVGGTVEVQLHERPAQN